MARAFLFLQSPEEFPTLCKITKGMGHPKTRHRSNTAPPALACPELEAEAF